MENQRLKEYCEAEFENIDAVITELNSVVKSKRIKYSTAELAAIATFIHNCYNGFENILKRILKSKQIRTKDAPTWHKDLLKASLDQEIITNDLYETLSNYLSFRHFFVHAYSFDIRWEELKPLVDSLKNTLKEFKITIYAFLKR
jgi:uncharacterized protein YutE (UPF0331/DUF86 family)